MALGVAVRAEGSIQPAVSSMRSGRLREAVSIHPETHTRLAQAPPHYHRAHILVSGPLNPEGSPLLLTGWEGIGRGGSLSPKVEPDPLPSTPLHMLGFTRQTGYEKSGLFSEFLM